MTHIRERLLHISGRIMPLARVTLGTALAAGFAALLAQPVVAEEKKPAPEEPAFLSQPSIVGGREVRRSEYRRQFRWVVTMVPAGSPNTLYCGGTLVDPEWVLTAAHCIRGIVPSQIQIRVGARTLSENARIIDVEGIVPHPNYNPDTYDSDVALIKLAEAVGDLPVVNIASNSETNRYAPPRKQTTILGWGDTSEGGDPSEILKRATVPIQSNRYCNRAYSGNITPNMICAGPRQGGTDACQGDSGGPLVAKDSEGDWIQVGITSFGIGCARQGIPGVYARVGKFERWIKQTIRGRSTCYVEDLASQIRQPNGFDCFGLAANDDSSTAAVPIGFPVNFGGETYEEIHVNNNGNLTFVNGLSTYTPVELANLTLPMIAPFFADVDTRAAGSQIVYYGQVMINGKRAFMALWQNVGYYNQKRDKLNTFQVLLIETRRNSGNFKLEFNYGKIEWETGDASGGTDGLGGDSARVGWNALGPRANNRELPGSGENGALIDGGPHALAENGNTQQIGRYSYTFRRGVGRGR